MKEKVLITAKITPDLDGVASAIAYAQYLNKTRKDAIYKAAFEGEITSEVNYVLGLTEIKFTKILKSKFNKFILADFSTHKGLPPVIEDHKSDVVEVIDHRIDIDYEFFPNAKAQVELVGANATLIAEKYYFEGIKLDRKIALLLYICIVSHTSNLKANVTTYRDKRIVSWLEREFKECRTILVNNLFKFKIKEVLKNLNFALNSDLRELEIDNYKIGIFQLELFFIKNLLSERINDIIKVMKQHKGLDWSFCNIADIKNGISIIIPTVTDKGRMFKRMLGAQVKGAYFVTDRLYLRKEIMPIIKFYYRYLHNIH